MKRQFAGLSDQGLVRSANQDAFCVDDPGGRYFIVADGMGGHAGGEEASRLATETIRSVLEAGWAEDLDPNELLERAFRQANRDILEMQLTHPERCDMGTTAVVVIFPEQSLPWCAHVGDSRLYRLRGEQLEQLTEDHTWVAQAVRSGILTHEQARSHPWRHVLAQCLGREELHQVDIRSFDVCTGDRLLLCSDGLTEEVPDPSIVKQLDMAESCSQAAHLLVEEAKSNGGQDNITVVMVEIEEAPAEWLDEDITSPDCTVQDQLEEVSGEVSEIA